MKRATLHHSLVMAVAAVLAFVFSPAYAVDKGCWVDLYDQPSYKGKHARITGPEKLKNLDNVAGSNWDKKIESLKVGPKALVTVYENRNFKLTLKEIANHPVLMESLGITAQDVLEDSELIFRSGVNVHNFGEFRFNHKIRSLKLECVK